MLIGSLIFFVTIHILGQTSSFTNLKATPEVIVGMKALHNNTEHAAQPIGMIHFDSSGAGTSHTN